MSRCHFALYSPQPHTLILKSDRSNEGQQRHEVNALVTGPSARSWCPFMTARDVSQCQQIPARVHSGLERQQCQRKDIT